VNQINFLFKNLKFLSANKAYKNVVINRKSRRAKTADAKGFEKRVVLEMLKRKPDIFEFQKHYSPHEHVLIGTVYMFLPKNKLFKADETISKTGGDVNNNKVFTDSIFSVFDELDDAMLISEPPFKLISPDKNHHMGYILEIYDKDNVERWSENAWEKINQ
jgi:hypothetical protein